MSRRGTRTDYSILVWGVLLIALAALGLFGWKHWTGPRAHAPHAITPASVTDPQDGASAPARPPQRDGVSIG